jgi:LacI family repressor for deo operon, udp, cdd, tsx, nupC, and nupG
MARQTEHRGRSSRRSATIHDVAARAGLSTATVSRTLATPELVSEGARERVLAAIKATGYTPNVAARNLRARRTMMILVVVPNIGNYFFSEVVRGIDDELVASGYGMIIANLSNMAEREARYVDLVFAGQVDGVLLLGGRVPAGNGRLMTDAGLPIATICVAIPGTRLPFVMVDDIEASKRVVEHLHGLGHRRFGYVSGPQGNLNEIGRRAGFRAALGAVGIDPDAALYWPGDFMPEAGIAAARDFLTRNDRPTAVYAVSDNMAIGFLKTVTAAGVRVPEDLSIVGFDGIEYSDFVTPSLTTIRQPRHELGRMAARMLLEALTGARTRNGTYVRPELIIRGSTGPVPSATLRTVRPPPPRRRS